MWTYSQSTGTLCKDGKVIGAGYSGFGTGKNDPNSQAIHNFGPIPRGIYTICQPRDSEDHGPFVLPLVPESDNQMFGRAGFLIHGDSIPAPGTASRGCIILARNYREQIWNSGDHAIQVVKG